MLNTAFRGIAALTFVLLSASAFASECEGFKWDVSREKALFTATPRIITAVADAARSPVVQTEALYELRLLPQERLSLAVAPSKKSIADGASAGLVRFRVPETGAYRVALDRGFWIDVVADGKTVPSTDFSGSPQCRAPRKIVMYTLPAAQDLVLQFTGAVDPQLRFAITAVAQP